MTKINGIEALKKMRSLQNDPEAFFTMHHITYNSSKDTTSGVRIVTRCRLRPALGTEFSNNVNHDDLLPYVDLDKDKEGMCYKKLIRKVAFPPDFTLLKVKWYE